MLSRAGSSELRAFSRPPARPPFPPRRLEGLDLGALRLQSLLVDPPRAGLDGATRQLLRDFQAVVYVSCNPGGREGGAGRGSGGGAGRGGAGRGLETHRGSIKRLQASIW